jgi:hypothetical protein
MVPTLWRGNHGLSRSSGVYETGRWSVQGLRTHTGAWVRWGQESLVFVDRPQGWAPTVRDKTRRSPPLRAIGLPEFMRHTTPK